jgi:hypothetical protein
VDQILFLYGDAIYNHVNLYSLFPLNMNERLLNRGRQPLKAHRRPEHNQKCPGWLFTRSQVAPGVSFAYFTPHCVAPCLLLVGHLYSGMIASSLVDEILAALAIELLDQIQIGVHWNARVYVCRSTVVVALHHRHQRTWLPFVLRYNMGNKNGNTMSY